MAFRRIAVLFVVVSACSVANLLAQPLGTFRWQLEPFGSVLNLNVTQEGAIYLLNGFEAQCSNPSLPVWGVAVPQANGTVLIGLTTITSNGNGLHTRASIAMSTFGGSWVDNANNSGTFLFNPGNTCPGGPRTGPVEPDPRAAMSSPDVGATAATLDALRAEIDVLQKHVMALEAKKP